MKLMLLSVGVAMGLASAAGPASAQSACDRTCLSTKLDQFLQAVVAKDPSKANLWVGARQTENGVVIVPGEGIWKTNSGLGSLDRRYYDPKTGQAEFFGTMNEGAERPIVSLRLKIENQKVTEGEWHIARKDSPGIQGDPLKNVFDVDNLLQNPPEQRVVPVAQRAPRDELIAAVDSYFDGITTGTGRNVQANPGCFRLENGVGAPQPGSTRPVSPEDADFQTKPDCRSGYANLNIVNVQARRYLMVDEQAQIVLASVVFIREPLSPKRRNSFMEVFYMDGGKISSVYAAMVYADPLAPMPNWAPYEGNFPIGQNLIQHN